jgi:hypothetical protein
MNTPNNWYCKARDRVEASPSLREYYYELLEYPWDEPEHFQWVATASLTEILEWCGHLGKLNDTDDTEG